MDCVCVCRGGGVLLHECPSEDHPLISYTNVLQLQVNVCFVWVLSPLHLPLGQSDWLGVGRETNPLLFAHDPQH